MSKHESIIFSSAIAILLLATCASVALAGAPKMKMTTDIPTNVITPDKTETRLGTLRVFFYE
jgi:hypothetical protein